MVSPLTLVSSGLSLASMVDAAVLHNSRPEVSTSLLWFSVVTGVIAITSEAAAFFDGPNPDWQPELLSEAHGSPERDHEAVHMRYALEPPERSRRTLL
jgi:hypothetical protein